MKVALVVANYAWFGKRPWKGMTTSVPIITAVLKNQFELAIIDANVNEYSQETLKRKLEEYSPQVVMVTALSVEYFKAYHTVARLSKEALPKVQVIMGGVYPTVCPEDVIGDENVDIAMMGHAEGRLDLLLSYLEKGDYGSIECFEGIAYRKEGEKRVIPLSHYIGDVPRMVKPDYSLIDVDKYLDAERKSIANQNMEVKGRSASIISSYGCPYNCLFCATRTISGRKVAYRPADDVLEEIDFFVREKQVEAIIFIDDCILADKERAKYLFQEIINRKYHIEIQITTVAAWHLDREILQLMKEAGLSKLGISVESGNERVLHKIIHKPLRLEILPDIVSICRELDILMRANFVIGFPGETWDDIRDSLRAAEALDFDLVDIHIATVLPKTELYELAIKTHSLPEGFSFFSDDVNFGFGKGNITTDEFTPGELMVIRAYEWDRINFSTSEKRMRACRVMGITEEELQEHRRQTRRHCGMYF
ncbi:MAG: radical SAM protein [Lachnospiraceae bacterium]|nr:radical SAM protein [Lachnospiraceae bacterium]